MNYQRQKGEKEDLEVQENKCQNIWKFKRRIISLCKYIVNYDCQKERNNTIV